MITLVAVLVLAVVVAGAVLIHRKPAGPPQRGAATPEAAVQGFLDALAANHAQQALFFEEAGVPHDLRFLTDAVLASAHKTDPISKIVVHTGPESAGLATQVSADFQVGSSAASTTFDLVRGTDKANWTIGESTIRVSLASVLEAEVPMRLSGVSVQDDTVELFPGVYRASTGLSALDWGSDPRLSVTNYDPTAGIKTKLGLRITSAGRTSVVSAVEKSVSACFAKHTDDPGCGLDPSTTGYTFSKGSIRWTYADKKSPWNGADFALDNTRHYVAVGPDQEFAEMTATCNKVARARDCKIEGFASSFGTPEVDLSAKTPEVSWT